MIRTHGHTPYPLKLQNSERLYIITIIIYYYLRIMSIYGEITGVITPNILFLQNNDYIILTLYMGN